jgi:predicted ferric reductase
MDTRIALVAAVVMTMQPVALAAATSSSGGSGATAISQDEADPDLNESLASYLLIVCGAVSIAVVAWRAIRHSTSLIRTVVSLGNNTQQYFALASPRLEAFKTHILWAPVMRKRHNREIQLSTAINIGTLPTRLQLLFLIGYLATNVGFCVIHIPFAESFDMAAAQLRSRSGTLCVVNMIALFLMAGRNNPLLPTLAISFDTFNLLHRWFGRIVTLEALTHVIAHYASKAHNQALGLAFKSTFSSDYMLPGFVAVCAFVAIVVQASSPLRHAFYETFKLLHIMLAIAAVVGIWYHLYSKEYPQLVYLIAAIAVWVFDRVSRTLRLVYYSFGNGGARAVVEALPGNATRITVALARPWSFKPGQHAYLYMPTISMLQSHPFSAAWAEQSTGSDDDEEIAVRRRSIGGSRNMTVAFVVRARTGFTNALYQRAVAAPNGVLETTCWVEGPYGGYHPLVSYGTVLLFAGGVGITHQVPYVRSLLEGAVIGTVATRKITLVWIIQSPEHLEWIRPWMTEILAMEKRREILRIMLFVSRPKSTKEIHSPSATVQMFPGRPNIDTLIGIETEQQVGAMAVTVCGPGALSDEVRRAVRIRNRTTTIDFVEEAFAW